MPSIKPSWIFPALAALIGGAITAAAQDELFVSKQLTPKNEYTFQIEGPAVDRAGNLYVGNLAIKTDAKTASGIGKVKANDTKSTLFATLPVTNGAKSKTSGMRFDRDGRLYTTDFNGHQIFVFSPGETKPQVYFKAAFHQPNDLAMAKDGTLYASDPLRKTGVPVSGRIWRITRGVDGKASGAIMESPRAMGATNGIDLSPDDATLYASESTTGQVWSYRIDGSKLTDAQLLATLQGGEVDGLRTDVEGRIYITQNGAGRISVLTAKDEKARDPIVTTGKNPSNLTFGGPDGKTVFVTQADGGFIETFRVDRPGREPCLQSGAPFC